MELRPVDAVHTLLDVGENRVGSHLSQERANERPRPEVGERI